MRASLFSLLIGCGVGLSSDLMAQVSEQYMTSAEALAMGNAYVAVAEDGYSLFYNPSGLARANRWAFFPMHGAFSFTSGFLSAARAITDNSGVINRVNALAGKRVFFDTYVFPHFQIPYFAGGFIGRIRVQQYTRNPVYPKMNSDVFFEWGLIGGFAFPAIPGILDLGASVKYVSRHKALSFENQDSDEFLAAILNNSYTSYLRKGAGYSANVGASIRIPNPVKTFRPVLGVAIEEAGTLTFRNGSAPRPKRLEQSLNAGIALNYAIPYAGDLTIAFDVRRLLNREIEYPQKMHLGVRWKFPMVTVYGGLNGGWLTGGLKLDFELMSINMLTYEEELGSYAGARGDRRYMFEMSMGFDFEGLNFSKMSKRRR